MPILLFAENNQGIFKKPVFEAATYARDLAESMNTDLIAVSVGNVSDEELKKLGTYGVSKVHAVSHDKLDSFINAAYASAIYKIAKREEVQVVVIAQTYDGRAVASRLAAKLKASPLSGMVSIPQLGEGLKATRIAYSSKAVETVKPERERWVITVKTNGYKISENPTDISVVTEDYIPNESDLDTVAKEIVKASEGISLTEAEIVVSAGRGMKGPENWGIIEELAGLLGAATACSKPTADMGWRPHHEHVWTNRYTNCT